MESVYTSAASLYGFRRQHLIPSLVLRERKNPQPSVPRAVFFCVLSYFWSVYGFAIAYTYISRSDPKSFNVGELGLFDATYFSFTTAATVGYGDIVPISMVARMLVMLEIALGLMYVVFFFSVIAGELQRSRVSTELMGSVGDPTGREVDTRP
jgi:hypothetical protein